MSPVLSTLIAPHALDSAAEAARAGTLPEAQPWSTNQWRWVLR